MTPELFIYCEQVALDAAKALPAALVAAVLVQRAKPRVAAATKCEKALAFLASLMAGVMAGQLAREFEQTRGFASVAVIAGAFLSQDLAMAAATWGRKSIKRFNPLKGPTDSHP